MKRPHGQIPRGVYAGLEHSRDTYNILYPCLPPHFAPLLRVI